MWTRRQQISLICSFIVLVLIFSSRQSSKITKHASHVTSTFEFTAVSPGVVLPKNSSRLEESSRTLSDTADITETTLVGGAGAWGFTVFDHLYLRNGTFVAVTTEPAAFPDPAQVLSKPLDLDATEDLTPTSKEMQITSPEVATKTLGDHAITIKGTTVLFYDTDQFMSHYYHWWGEIMIGAIRKYSSLELEPGLTQPLPPISRFMIPHSNGGRWKDYSGMDGALMRLAFPQAAIEDGEAWVDMMGLGLTFVFERIMIVSRVAAHKDPQSKWNKMIYTTMKLPVPEHFWEPLRHQVVMNSIGHIPQLDDKGLSVSETPSSPPVVTYISRQNGGRRLTHEAHQNLVASLEELEKDGICKVVIANMEQLGYAAQIELSSKTTIMLGVHGNGLTHQLWMPPTPRSTVIEIYFPDTYTHDYEILATNMGHKHFAVWNETVFEFGSEKKFDGVEWGRFEDFSGNNIPIYGPTVARKIREILTS